MSSSKKITKRRVVKRRIIKKNKISRKQYGGTEPETETETETKPKSDEPEREIINVEFPEHLKIMEEYLKNLKNLKITLDTLDTLLNETKFKSIKEKVSENLNNSEYTIKKYATTAQTYDEITPKNKDLVKLYNETIIRSSHILDTIGIIEKVNNNLKNTKEGLIELHKYGFEEDNNYNGNQIEELIQKQNTDEQIQTLIEKLIEEKNAASNTEVSTVLNHSNV